MTDPGTHPIPYEKQSDGESNRMCGAAALRMVYRSLGGARAERFVQEHAERRTGEERRVRKAEPPGGRERREHPRRIVEVAQSDIWKRIARPNRGGSPACATNLMVRDALARGFAAVAVQALNPLQMLLACQANGIRAILNHRFRLDGPAGHFTVFLGMDAEGVVVHDPHAGPSRRVRYGELLELWQPRFPGSEIIGNVLIGIADHPPRLEKCTACSVPIPDNASCPQCRGPVLLSPSAFLGCVGGNCVHRSWLRVCCPSCDYTFPFTGKPEDDVPTPGQTPVELGPLFAQLDRFRAHILSNPELAGRADVQQQLSLLEEHKVKLRLAEQEEIGLAKQEEADLQERLAAADREKEKARNAREQAASAAAPPDGDALVAGLMKKLGLAG